MTLSQPILYNNQFKQDMLKQRARKQVGFIRNTSAKRLVDLSPEDSSDSFSSYEFKQEQNCDQFSPYKHPPELKAKRTSPHKIHCKVTDQFRVEYLKGKGKNEDRRPPIVLNDHLKCNYSRNQGAHLLKGASESVEAHKDRYMHEDLDRSSGDEFGQTNESKALRNNWFVKSSRYDPQKKRGDWRIEQKTQHRFDQAIMEEENDSSVANNGNQKEQENGGSKKVETPKEKYCSEGKYCSEEKYALEGKNELEGKYRWAQLKKYASSISSRSSDEHSQRQETENKLKRMQFKQSKLNGSKQEISENNNTTSINLPKERRKILADSDKSSQQELITEYTSKEFVSRKEHAEKEEFIDTGNEHQEIKRNEEIRYRNRTNIEQKGDKRPQFITNSFAGVQKIEEEAKEVEMSHGNMQRQMNMQKQMNMQRKDSNGFIRTKGGICFDYQACQFATQKLKTEEPPATKPAKKKRNINSREEILRRRQKAKIYDQQTRCKIFGDC